MATSYSSFWWIALLFHSPHLLWWSQDAFAFCDTSVVFPWDVLFIKTSIKFHKTSSQKIGQIKLTIIIIFNYLEYFSKHENREEVVYFSFSFLWSWTELYVRITSVNLLFVPSWLLIHFRLYSPQAFVFLIIHSSKDFARGLEVDRGPLESSRCPACLRHGWHMDDEGDGKRRAASSGMTYLVAWGCPLLQNYWS